MQDAGLHTLKPARGATKTRKRVGRGPGSRSGKTAGRGNNGQKSRSGSHNVRAGFEGGQMPLYLRISKQRGSNKKMSMPMGPFRTETQAVNVSSLDRFDAGTDVTPQVLKKAGLIRNLRTPVKVLGNGDVSTKLTISVHKYSASARTKLEAAGCTVNEVPFVKNDTASDSASE